MQYEALLPKILSMSLTGSVVILAVLLARLPLKRAPKVFSYALWAVVLLRLLCPAALELPVSAVPDRIGSGELVANWADDYAGDTKTLFPAADGNDAAIDGGGEAAEQDGYAVTAGDGVLAPAAVQSIWFPALSVIWLVGVAAMLIYSAVSLLLLRRRLVGAVRLRDNVFAADHIDTPFVMGLFRPKIYLPSTLSESRREFIILHERYHIRRLDHAVKLLFFAALCLHWFNPLVWLAFSLMGRDMEMSCDEAVLRRLGGEIRADYSASLLSLSSGRRIIAGTPLAFGEGDPKSRIKNVLSWKKPTVWMIIGAGVLCAAVVVLCAVNPKSEKIDVPELSTGDVYVSENCLYMNPLSSFLPVDGDSGYSYLIGEDSFTLINRADETERSISPVIWGWQELPWTKEQWSELFWGIRENGINDMVSLEAYKELLYQPLDDKLCLIKADSRLLLLEIHNISKMGKQVWSIYTLSREKEKQTSDLRGEAAAFTPSDIHDLVSAELRMSYGSCELTDAESLTWLEENLGTATELTDGPTCPVGIELYLTRSDGVTGVIYPAEDSNDVFKSGESYYDWQDGDNTGLRALFGTDADYVQREYDSWGQIATENLYSWNRLREVREYEYGSQGEALKITSTNGTRKYVVENEYENGLLVKQTSFVDGQLAFTTETEYDEDGDRIRDEHIEPMSGGSSISTYEYGTFYGKKRCSKMISSDLENKTIRTESYEYNEAGWRIRDYTVDADGAFVLDLRYEYNDRGTYKSITSFDEQGNKEYRTEYEYDEAGEVKYVSHYDKNGKLTERKKPLTDQQYWLLPKALD